jgi:hypothetical protein
MSAAVIDISEADIVLTRRAGDGRFVIFTSTDVRPSWPLPWWGAVADTGGDGFGLLARIDEVAAPAGWTARQLLVVARARLAAEADRQANEATVAALECLDHAAAAFREPVGPADAGEPVTFEQGNAPSPYPWTVACCGAFRLQLCPDPEGLGEGITPEQLLIILDQLLHDAARAYPHARALWVCRRYVGGALAAEARRAAAARGAGRMPPNH